MKYNKIDLEQLRTFPIAERKNKVKKEDFSKGVGNAEDIFEIIPDILMGSDIKEVVRYTAEAKQKGKIVIWAMGGHVIKCGLNPVIIELMQKGIVDAIALNGAGSIHDFELAMIGETSEDVSAVLGEGAFGMAQETGFMYNDAINTFTDKEMGLGERLGKYICEKNFEYKNYSLLATAYQLDIPVTVHVAIGNDITHMHANADGAAIGKTSYIDFIKFTSILPNLDQGGVYFNIGSAVLLPEVFLKAFSIVQNLGYDVKEFTTVNMDMMTQYRPLTNVVRRPTDKRGKGFNLIGAHEILIPLIAYGLCQKLK